MSLRTLSYIQIGLSIVLMVSILLQQRGTGVGATFGGGGAIRTERRGAEKILFYITIVISILFVASAISSLILSALEAPVAV